MSLKTLLVRRHYKRFNSRGFNLSTTTCFGVADERIISVVPSTCKKAGQSDGLVNSRVRVNEDDAPSGYTDYWVTQTVAQIIG